MSTQSSFIRLSRGWAYMRADGATDLWSLATGRRFRLHGEVGAVERLLVRLKRGVAVPDEIDALAEFAEISANQLRQLLARLQREGAVLQAPPLSAAPTEAARSLYDPQIEFFHMFERDGADGRVFDAQMRHRRVVVVGVGGYGSFITQLLARIGVRRIAAVDMDRVELSNLSRQVLYGRDDIGMLKAEAAGRRVCESDAEIDYEPHVLRIRRAGDLVPVVASADLVFSPFGYLRSDIGDCIMQACRATGTPLLSLGMTTLGPLWLPGRTACQECMRQQQSKIAETLRLIDAEGWMPPRGPFAPPIALMCSFAVWEAARFLSGCDEPRTLHGMFSFDPIKYVITFWPGDRFVGCSLCGDGLPGVKEEPAMIERLP